MWSLIRRQEVWRHLPRTVLIALAAAALVMSITTLQLAYGREPATGWVAPVLLFLASLIVFFPGAGRRAREFDLALPIPARRLWLAHLGGLLAAGAIVLAATSLVYLGGLRLLTSLFESRARLLGIAGPLLCVPAACYVLLVAARLSLGTERQELPRGPLGIAALAGALFLALLLARLLAGSPWFLWAVPLAPAVLLLLRAYHSVPAALSLVPAAPRGTAAVAGGWLPDRVRPRPLLLDWTIQRSLAKSYAAVLMVLVLVALAGVLLAGGVGAFLTEQLRFSMIFITAYLLLSTLGTPLGKLALLEAWPLSRERIFANLALPLIGSLLLGYGAGRLAVDAFAPARELVRYDDSSGQGHVLVPVEFWDVALDGRIPAAVTASRGGEPPRSIPLVQGAALRLYNPFSTGEQDSRETVAERIARAVDRVYGQTISPVEVASRYLETSPSGRVLLRAGGLSLRADHPQWQVRGGGPVAPVICGIALLLWLGALAVYFAAFRPGVGDKVRRRLFWSLMAVLLLLHMAQYALAIADVVYLDGLEALWPIQLRRLDTTPGILAVYGCSGALVALAYLAVQRRFRRLEAAASCFKVCL
jgi:hypothetical protein